MNQNLRTIIYPQIQSVIAKLTMTKDKDTRKELLLHKELIRDLMRQINATMSLHPQICELIELIIKIVLKQHNCKGCSSNTVNESGSSDDDKKDKFKLHKQKNKESRDKANELYTGK